jgi:Caspase domain/TIR domain
MTGIFINYRREDAPGVAGRLFDRLATNYSRREMFMDVDAMKPGLNFVKQIDEQISKCDVVLAIIGPGWLNAVDDKGQRKIDKPRDYVRVELAAALKREIPVIPLLVNGTVMPSEDELPEELKSLPHRHSLELRHSRFSADSDAVIQAVGEIVPSRRAWPFVVGAVAGMALLGSLTGFVIWRTTDRDQTVIRPVASAAATATPPAVKQPDPLSAAPQPTPTPVPVATTTPSAPSREALIGQSRSGQSSPAIASSDRIAIVIGNAKYPDVETLKTPVADARLMASGLSRAGFAVVTGENLTVEQTKRMLEQFYARIKPDSVVLLFFSGYAIQADRQSYLIPVDAQISKDTDVARYGIGLESILWEINQRGASLKIALLDGARRNPIERRFRNFWAGLAPVNAPTGTLVMYSVALSSVQSEYSSGDHSVFVTELLKNVGIPNLTAEEALNRTRLAISAATHGEQVPWVSSSIAEDFTLAPAPETPH